VTGTQGEKAGERAKVVRAARAPCKVHKGITLRPKDQRSWPVGIGRCDERFLYLRISLTGTG
jgi:hypothetical protein